MNVTPLFLGLDLSTQSFKVLLLDNNLTKIYFDSIIFSSDLPHYKTENGVLHNNETNECFSPVLMFIEALDLLLTRMKKKGVPFENIVAISGSGQQHGSVYWGSEGENLLKDLDYNKCLLSQFDKKDIFSCFYAPIWMDSTTTKYCTELENVYGIEKLCEVTGSRAFERFTGNQIKKIYIEKNDIYCKTVHISLISTFISELFLGKFAPADYSDASGMNLFNINTKKWDFELLSLSGGDFLNKKLLPPVPSTQLLGLINQYFVKKYGFNKICEIFVFSGDNPCSMVGLGITHPGIVGISLGTSDTIFSLLNKKRKSNIEGHLFTSPLNEDDFMMMVCMKNGALVREKYKRLYGENDWEIVESLLKNENIDRKQIFGYFFEYPEICPLINTRDFAYFKGENIKEIEIESLKNEEIMQCLYESKAFLLKLSLESFGIQQVEKVIITGGSSKSKAFLQIIADIFNCDIYKVDSEETAVLGAVYRAYHGYYCEKLGKFTDFEKIIPFDPCKYELIATPNQKRALRFKELLIEFSVILNELILKFPY